MCWSLREKGGNSHLLPGFGMGLTGARKVLKFCVALLPHSSLQVFSCDDILCLGSSFIYYFLLQDYIFLPGMSCPCGDVQARIFLAVTKLFGFLWEKHSREQQLEAAVGCSCLGITAPMNLPLLNTIRSEEWQTLGCRSAPCDIHSSQVHSGLLWTFLLLFWIKISSQ